MTSASKKRRRRREREKRAEELLQRARAISLVDVASPPPTIDPSNTGERRQGWTKRDLNSSTENRGSEIDSAALENPVSSPTNPPKEFSWKRVDFVLPRADGKKRFVFDRQIKPEVNGNTAAASQESGDTNENNLKDYRKFETIEDILFAGKRQKERVPQNNNLDSAKDEDDGSRKRAKTDDKNASMSESQRKTLESAFESVNQVEKGQAIGNYVDIPKSNEQGDGENGSLSKVRKLYRDSFSSDEKPKASLTTEDPDEVDDQKRKPISINTNPPSPGQISGRTVKEAVRDKRGLRPRANSTDGELNLPRGGLCDERMILEAHKWNTERKFTHQTHPRGFHNLGNTCFLNATLQCLTYLPPFCQTLIAISNTKISNEHNGGKRKVPQGQRITSSLCNLFQQAHGLNGCSSAVGGPFAPKKVVNHLQNIGSCGSQNGHKFKLGRQEDAHEFLVHLLDAMNDGELRAAGINQTVSGWRDRLPASRLDETTFVHRIFGGYFRSQVRCRRCNYKSNTYDPFLDLSLEVSKKSSTSVLRALSEFTRKETLDAANQWKCSGCKKYVCATKQLTVFRPPLSLCIQLKRFAFDNSFGFGQKFSKYNYGYGGGGGGSKITKPIEFPGTLHLPLSDNRSCQYALTGVVIHVGGSSQSGHYTAYVKKPSKNGNNQWYHLDDSHVEPVSERTVLRQKDAYLLFYCRTEVKLEFPDPPSRSMSASEATEFGRTRALARANSLPSDISKKHVTIDIQITDEDISAFPAGLLKTELSRNQQEAAVPCSKKEQKADVQKVKTTNHPLRNSSKNESFIASTASPNDDSAQKKSPEDCDTGINNARNDRSGESAISERSEGRSYEFEKGGEATNDKNKVSLKSSAQSAKSDENTTSADKFSPVDEKKIRRKEDDSSSQSSTSEDSSESDSDSEDESSDEEKKIPNNKQTESYDRPERKPAGTASKKAQVVQNNTDSRGKVKVVLGNRKRNLWGSIASALPSKGSDAQLLGNMKVSQWDKDNDDDSSDEGDAPKSAGNQQSQSEVHLKRKKIVDKIDKQNRSRKRKMHLDRWDSHLDQGKLKKVKTTSNVSAHQTSSTAPKKNIFQRIQSGVQRMSRGKPKGLMRRKFKNRKGKF